MADESHILNLLEAHHSYQEAISFTTPESNPFTDLVPQFFPGHVRLLPAVLGNHPLVGPGGIVDDFVNRLEFIGGTPADHVALPSRETGFYEGGVNGKEPLGNMAAVFFPSASLRMGSRPMGLAKAFRISARVTSGASAIPATMTFRFRGKGKGKSLFPHQDPRGIATEFILLSSYRFLLRLNRFSIPRIPEMKIGKAGMASAFHWPVGDFPGTLLRTAEGWTFQFWGRIFSLSSIYVYLYYCSVKSC
jgi:hypothetical protein